MNLTDKYSAHGEEWAIVTGAAGGIGFALADSLGALGYNLALVDIDADGLRRVGNDLHERHAVRVVVMELDLSRRESAGRLHDFCDQQEIDPMIVVNNAGIFRYRDIVETDTGCIELFTGLHIETTTLICRLFAVRMAARGRGYILNMSSYSTWMPWPGLALYSATKAYIRSFSLALAAEMRERGVVVTTSLPAGVTTGLYGLSEKWRNIGRSMGVLLTPERTAELSLRAMFRGRRQYVPSVFMRMVLPLVRTLPRWAVRIARKKTMRFQK